MIIVLHSAFNGTPIYLNANYIESFSRDDKKSKTNIFVTGVEDNPYCVSETPEEIFKYIEHVISK